MDMFWSVIQRYDYWYVREHFLFLTSVRAESNDMFTDFFHGLLGTLSKNFSTYMGLADNLVR